MNAAEPQIRPFDATSGVHVSLLIPAFNESAHLEASLQIFWKHMRDHHAAWEIVVVDDGSTDETLQIAQRFANVNEHVRVITHPQNMGLGQALRSGFRACRGTYIVTCDADLSYDTDHIDRLLATIEVTGAQTVVASPYMAGGEVSGVPRLRRILSRGANRLLRVLTRTRIATVTGMVRAYERQFLSGLSLKSVDNQINAEIVYKTELLRGTVVEIPAHLNWTRDEQDTNRRKVHLSLVRTTLDFLFSGFIFRPFMFFVLPGALLLLMATYALGWSAYHTFASLPEAGGLIDRFSEGLAAAFELSPHSFLVGGLAMIFAVQLISVGVISAQSKRYFEDLYFHTTSVFRAVQADERAVSASPSDDLHEIAEHVWKPEVRQA